MINHFKVSIAPMLERTDRHDRFFLRLISENVRLYSEMITTGALIHGDTAHFLAFHPDESPIALQLGGSDPAQLAYCAKLGENAGYDEINLNVGCPSDRVKNGHFGACLMLKPGRVAECVAAMQAVVKIPVTVKCRIGVDTQDPEATLPQFITEVADAGCQVFIIHARKAWLQGLSPKQNREVPPLQYNIVQQIKKSFPKLTIIINGGIKTITDIEAHLAAVDGVMIGREAYTNPYFLAEIEKKIFRSSVPILTRQEVVQKFVTYVEQQLAQNIKLTAMTRHILGLFYGEKGASIWKRTLSEEAHLTGAGIHTLLNALEKVTDV